MAKLTAPTLYHHYGSADGLLSVAPTEAFAQFLARKNAAGKSPEPLAALREGRDDDVRFAAARTRRYAAMLSRVLQGAQIPAAQQAVAPLIERVRTLERRGRLSLGVEAAADVMWAGANSSGQSALINRGDYPFDTCHADNVIAPSEIRAMQRGQNAICGKGRSAGTSARTVADRSSRSAGPPAPIPHSVERTSSSA